MGKILKKLLKTILIVGILMYFCIVMAKQEITFNKYDKELKSYNTKISEEELKYKQLMSTKEQISSDEYIEEVAREKLGLVMPNEIVFIDASL